jgi:hypothetical protein
VSGAGSASWRATSHWHVSRSVGDAECNTHRPSLNHACHTHTHTQHRERAPSTCTERLGSRMESQMRQGTSRAARTTSTRRRPRPPCLRASSAPPTRTRCVRVCARGVPVRGVCVCAPVRPPHARCLGMHDVMAGVAVRARCMGGLACMGHLLQHDFLRVRPRSNHVACHLARVCAHPWRCLGDPPRMPRCRVR